MKIKELRILFCLFSPFSFLFPSNLINYFYLFPHVTCSFFSSLPPCKPPFLLVLENQRSFSQNNPQQQGSLGESMVTAYSHARAAWDMASQAGLCSWQQEDWNLLVTKIRELSAWVTLTWQWHVKSNCGDWHGYWLLDLLGTELYKTNDSLSRTKLEQKISGKKSQTWNEIHSALRSFPQVSWTRTDLLIHSKQR